jgi:valyl-tRNA synthetase
MAVCLRGWRSPDRHPLGPPLCEIGFKNYKFGQIATTIYNFWLPEFEDFYPEKPNVEQQNRQNAIKLVLHTCLNNGLRLIAPIMPYLSEVIYQRLPENHEQTSTCSVCVTPYPESNKVNISLI